MQCIPWPVACSEWGACLTHFRFQILGAKWKFPKMSFRIRRNIELHFVAKFGENRQLRSCWKVVWITTQKNLGSTGLVRACNFAQNGPIAPKIPWMLSTYTEFGPDRLRFAPLIPQRLIFFTPKVNTTRIPETNESCRSSKPTLH